MNKLAFPGLGEQTVKHINRSGHGDAKNASGKWSRVREYSVKGEVATGWSGWALEGGEAGIILSRACVRDHRGKGLAWSSLPSWVCTRIRSPGGPGCLRTRSILLRSQRREDGSAAAAASLGKKRSIHVVNGTLFSPVTGERERQPFLPVQGKERDPYGERNLLQLSGKKKKSTEPPGPTEKEMDSLVRPVLKGWDGDTSKVGLWILATLCEQQWEPACFLATHSRMPCTPNTWTDCAKPYVPNSQRPWLSTSFGRCDFCIMFCCDVTWVDVCVVLMCL